jgi:hypothetical protein
MELSQQILDTQLVRGGPPAPPAPGFTVGGVLSKTVTVWWRHVLPFTVMSLFVYAPLGVVFGSILGAATPGQLTPTDETIGAFLLAGGLVSLLTVAGSVIQAGAVTFGTIRYLSGERVGLGGMVRVGFKRGLPVLGVGFLLWIGIMLGFVLLVVPGILLLVATCVAVPAAVAEQPGVIGAIRRSFALTRGNRGALFAAGFSILVVLWVLTAVVQIAATLATTALLPPQQAVIGAFVASQLGNMLFSALPVVGISVAYHDLRVAKEGVDTAALARVFE